jgi:hypothetical protein
MASVITALAPTLFSAAQEVSAEPFGAINSIRASFDNKGVAKGDTVSVPVAPVQSNTTFTPAATTTEGTSVTAAAVGVTISKSQKNSMVLNGEQIRSLQNGSNYQEWTRQWAAQAMRALRNEAEADCCAAIKEGASRAYGTAGTTPFATSLTELTAINKILRDNGAPMADLQFVGNSSVEMNLLNLNIVQQAFAAGTDFERRSGRLGKQFGFSMNTSAGIAAHTKGTLTATVSDNAAAATLAIGTLSVNCDGSTSDTNTVLAGDIITWAGDTNKYVIGTAIASMADNTAIVMNRPGLRATLADGVTGTLGSSYTPSLAFERSAVVGIMRPPLIPPNATIRQMSISDQYGMTYLFLEIEQYGQITWEMHLAWGFKVVQQEHVALLLG